MSPLLRSVSGSRDRRPAVTRPVTLAAGEVVPPPAALEAPAAAVWMELAPHAVAMGTLHPGAGYAFGLLCRAAVLERELAGVPEQRGGANHRGAMQRLETMLMRFMLTPVGKPQVDRAEPEDEWAAFDVVQGGKIG
jgi:hypothetical protein